MLAGVILAGGKSSRMGTDKSALVLPKEQQSLLENGIQKLAPLCDGPVFVSGAQQPNGIADLIPDCGPLSGIHAVITHIQAKYKDINELLVVAVDMPDLSEPDLTHLLKVGCDVNKVCCFDNAYLPMYIPLIKDVTVYLHNVLMPKQDKGLKRRQYALKNMLDALNGKQIPLLEHTQLTNINTLAQWQQRCAKQTVI